MLCSRTVALCSRSAATRTSSRGMHTVASRNVVRQHNAFTSPIVLKRGYAVGDKHIVKVPGMGDSISEGRVQEWLVEIGGQVNAHDTIASLETEKVAQPVNAPVAGTITKYLAEIGDDVRVGADLFEMVEGEAVTKTPEPKKAKAAKAEPAKAATPAATTPAATPAAATSAPRATPTPAPAAPVQKGSRNERREKMSKMRLKIAERLKDSQNTAAMLTTFNEIDMENIINLRNKYKEAFEKKHGVKLGFMSAFVKAASAALADFPAVNAVIDGTDIVYRDFHDISVAVAAPNGLVVPVLRNVEDMSFADIEKTIGAFGAKAKDGSLALEDMKGGTFTVSNGGVYGSMMGTPIINPPQSAILGMHGTTKRAVVVGNEIKIRPVMYVALTYDHRIIDGREAVLFLRKIKAVIEDPQILLLDL
eukprot:TRINITY_DN16997_c0_g1_i1.p1 TRINITY_DN16997_c0_g1~~TRINITY_DN16997_c0_g1_i1.p1  ORF type:complete len:420 (-),score=125.20 TRINITY_DN16997_c0_g1_i1:33-1292(-)